jgi:hypothetical protein
VVNKESDRRRHLRRLDDLLEALEQLNLSEITVVPHALAEELRVRGIDSPNRYSPSELIEKVWEMQQPYLLVVPVERRRRRRRLDRDPNRATVASLGTTT